MAIQFLPIIKAVAPYVAQVAAYAIPAFTAKPETGQKAGCNLSYSAVYIVWAIDSSYFDLSLSTAQVRN